MSLRVRIGSLAAACLLGMMATRVYAEIVVLASGRTLSASSYEISGEIVTLKLRGGGEMSCEKSFIRDILPDEMPPGLPVPPPPDVATTPAGSAVPYDELITSFAEAHGVDPMLVRAVIEVESNYEPRARSRKGAMGLMQLMPATARQYNVSNPYDPKANIAAGVKHLKSLIDRWGVELGLAAYNAGEGAVKRFNGIPPYQETRSYVRRILALAGAD